jgi:uncharacterized membrane protein HdeD (DUF308 family)
MATFIIQSYIAPELKKLCVLKYTGQPIAILSDFYDFLPELPFFSGRYLKATQKYHTDMDFPKLVLSESPIQWWQILLIGVIIFISGIDAFIWTSKFIDILLTLFGILALAVGLIMIAFSLSVKQDLIYRFPIFFTGLLSLIVAAIAILFPGFLASTFIIIMAILAIINSVLLIIVGCSLPDEWKTNLAIVLCGMVTLFLSFLMALFPSLTAVILVKIWGIYAMVTGGISIIAGIQMKRTASSGQTGAGQPV